MEELNIKATLSTETTFTTGLSIGKGEKGETGERGVDGKPFTYEDFTPEQLEALKPKKGIDYFDGSQGIQGVQGIQGEKGNPFTYADFTPEQLNALKPIKGVDYQDGYTPIKGVDYTDGYTPIKGIDYFDGKDGKDGINGTNGTNGYTPIKGVDYRDGIDGKNGTDGYTPIKGVDYRDGVDGTNGTNGKDGVSFDINTTYPTLATTDKTLIGAMNEVFQNVDNGKTLIASAISTKGVSTSKDDTFQTMATNIGNIQGGTSSEYTWTKPSGWLDLTQFNNDGQTIVAFLVRTDYPIYITLLSNQSTANAFDIDWGTGTWELGVSTTNINARMGLLSSSLGVDSTYGYKTAIIRIRKNSSFPSNYITTVKAISMGTTSTYPFCSGMLWTHYPNDIYVVNGSGKPISHTDSNGSYYDGIFHERISGYLKYVSIVGSSSSTSVSLKSIYSYDEITIPNGTNGIYNSGNGVPEIKAVTKITLTTSGTLAGFSNIPTNLEVTSGTYAQGYLFYKYVGNDVSKFNFSNITITNMAYFFNGSKITSLPYFNTSLVTNMANAFCYCIATKLPAYNYSSVTNMSSAFLSCKLLQEIDISSATSLTSYPSFSSLNSLRYLKLPSNWNSNLDVTGTSLSATELNRIFTELPTVTGKTITITNSFGASTCDKTIATAKGWTVTG